MIRILVVEDDAELAGNVGRVLAKEPDFQLMGIFPSAESALEFAAWGGVDVLLCDLGLPGMQGAELIRKIRARHPALVCLAYSLFSDDRSVFEALRAGAQGYLIKGCSAADLADSLRRVVAGESPMSPAIARKLLESFLKTPAEKASEPLTTRETAIVRQLADGYIYKEVADRLGISPHTVHSHIKKIYGKLQAATRAEAVRKAGELGYLRRSD